MGFYQFTNAQLIRIALMEALVNFFLLLENYHAFVPEDFMVNAVNLKN